MHPTGVESDDKEAKKNKETILVAEHQDQVCFVVFESQNKQRE